MKKRILNVLLLAAGALVGNYASAQCAAGESELFLTTSGGSFTSEKWVEISTDTLSGGTIIWDQDAGAGGGGTYGNGAGLVTNAAFCVTDGVKYFINAYDSFADGWDGTTYEIMDGSGTTVANNGGASPSDGTNADASGSFGDTKAQELEVSEGFTYFPPSCPAPTALNASNITATSADLSWTESGTALDWDLQWGVAGFTPSAATPNMVFTTMETAGGLTANTNYEFYVRSVCAPGDTSVFSGPFAFSTPCATYSVPYAEDFSTWVPTCWEEAGDGTWMAGPSGLGSGEWNHTTYLNAAGSNNAVKVNLYNTGSNEWILSPNFDLSSGGPYELVINAGVTSYNGTLSQAMGSDDSVMVFISNDAGTTWERIHFWAESNNPGNTGSAEMIDLSAYSSATTMFAIYASEGSTDDAEDFDFHINDFEIRMPPACADPIGFTATAYDTNAVELNWTAGGTETQWYIQYGPTGFTPGTGTFMSSFMMPDTITGLAASTDYDFYIQAVCAPGDSSTWVGPQTATTLDPPAYCESGVGPTSSTYSNLDMASMMGETTAISFTGTCSGTPTGLIDETSQSADVLTGYTYTIDLEGLSCDGGTWTNGISVWVDWNQDFTWDMSEQVGTMTGLSTPFTQSFTFTVPVTATLGATRMRVVQIETGSTVNDPCDSYSWGTTVDFTVNIGFGTSCAAVTGLTADYVGTDSVVVSWTPNGSEVGWNFELGADGFMPGTGAEIYASNPTSPIDSVAGLMLGTDYDVYVQADCGADSSVWVGPLDITTLLTCPSPSAFGGIVLSSDSISLSWMPGDSSETEWLIEYGVSGFTPGTGMQMSVFGSPADTVTGLMGATDYDFYLQGVCDVADSSFWIGPITFTTPASNDEACDAILVPADGSTGTYSTDGATANPAEPGDVTPSKTVWFKFSDPTAAGFNVQTCGTAWDTQIAAYRVNDCGDYAAYSLLDYNDDDCGLQSIIEFCVVPGDTVYVVVDPFGTSGAGGDFDLTVTPLETDAGTDGMMDVCESDTVNLLGVIGTPAQNGVFNYSFNPFAIVDDTTFNATIVPDGTHEVYYIINNACATDTAIATLNVQEAPSAGTAVVPFEACDDQVTSLWDGLSGSVDLSGTWNDDTGTGLLSGSTFNTVGIPAGTYQFTYTVNNGICPAVSTTVNVIVDECVSIHENPELDLTVYPNPNNGDFAIRNNGLSNDFVVKLMDINGKLVYTKSQKLNGADILEISTDVETGVYMLYVSSNDAVNTYKVVVK